MIDNHKVVCIIPARGGSKGVPRKNIKLLAGKPLIAYTIEQALESKYIDRTIVSTEDDEIADISRQFAAEVPFMRPENLAGDHVATVDVLLHAINWLEEKELYSFDILALLHTTTPLRAVEDIDACIEMLKSTKADNVFTVTEAYRNPYFNMVEVDERGKVQLIKQGSFTSRQSAPKVYDMNSSIYVWWKERFKKSVKIFMDNSRIYIMPKQRSVDIDDDIDFKIAEMIMAEKTKNYEVIHETM
ncbi:MAG TPA: acylneuraminate cytidylyltransferase family protein [Paludibacter sp.]|nr:acylneuraminate cytidylyltransferase family protein [Paludibacter sp.]HPM10138.1 acylneuraminate cytidylyltransferase family protein [Paludibacter sp.]